MKQQNVDTVPETSEAEKALVDIGAAYRDSNIEDILDELGREMVALQPVKTRIREITALLLVEQLRTTGSHH